MLAPAFHRHENGPDHHRVEEDRDGHAEPALVVIAYETGLIRPSGV